ncbi:protein NPAT [Betta splendens]|uniref:Protein NPAT n=1 Tax=Betta splendens TaxID=158456 RepID=A0A6P7PA52_BETSP|nr:protein NPAT [Betta splendens]XP_029027124.1 protein NPAT [Betta splendens]
MLLPSDVARLVLGYLQEEGLLATSQAFIHESPNLKEYAEHTTGDGTIPACVFSVFGKGLTTILNEYVAAKTKDSCHEVPAMLASLWKKLDFTLNQIKSMQNSPAISANQRTRSRVGVANMARQRVLAVASAAGVVCSSVSETASIISPTHTSTSTFSHSTPVNYTALHTRPAIGSGTQQQIHDGNRLLSTPKESPIQVIVSENRLLQGPMSPGRRKWEPPRKRSGGPSGPTASGKPASTVSSLSAEPQPEETVDENFPQLVIQNARDKILGDRSLQEKLAENINKILANDPTPQTSKAPSSTVEADQSIDEILGLQGEIHMSDDAIHDILEQTESDPAFQALFDLFDYNKTRFTDGEPGDGEVDTTLEETDTAGPPTAVRPLQTDNPGITNNHAAASETTQVTAKIRSGQDRKTRKSTAPLIKKIVLAPSNRSSRIENCSAKLLVTHGEHSGASSGEGDSNRKEKPSVFNNSATPMEIDEPLNGPPPSTNCIFTQESGRKTQTSTSAALSELTTAPSSRDSSAFAVPLVPSVSDINKTLEYEQAQGSKGQPTTAPSSALSSLPAFSSPLDADLSNTEPTSGLPHTASNSGDSQLLSVASVTSVSQSSTSPSTKATVTAPSASPPALIAGPLPSTSGSPTSASTSAVLTTTPALASLSSNVPVSAEPGPSTTISTTTSKAAADSSNVVSLKIIISENQDENSSTDTALNQAISSISGDKIPTIYLSSPVKSPVCPGTPKINLDEVAQAVSGLQNSEARASPLGTRAGALVASPLAGTSQAHQSYIIQLPPANPVLQGAAANYFLVAEPPTTDSPARQLVLPAGVAKANPLPINQFGVTTPACSQSYPTGSPLILPSPVKPLMLPVSVMGQNTLGNVQIMSNQLVALQNPVPTQPKEAVKPKPPTVAVKPPTTDGPERGVPSKVIQPVSTENAGLKDAVKGFGHRRILNFDSSSEGRPQTSKPTTNSTSSAANKTISQSVKQTLKDKTPPSHRIRPTILGGNKPKRRIETVRCSTVTQAKESLLKEAEMSLCLQQKDPVKKNLRKQDHKTSNKDSLSVNTSNAEASQPEKQTVSVSGGQSKRIDRHNFDKVDKSKLKDSNSSKSLSSDSALKSGSRKEKEESGRQDSTENAPAQSREGRTEKRASSQETPNVTANKENEMKGKMQEQQQQSPLSSAPAVTHPTANALFTAAKAPSKTSSLAKQAAEMLQDIQGIKSPSTAGASSADPSVSWTAGTSHNQEDSAECQRTPSRQRKGKDGEGTPKHVMLPTTPDVPTCSPASEAGSENSINMAAHTLMILSRAAIARTGTPLKDSLRQEEVGEKATTSTKMSKKRKQPTPTSSPPLKKELKRSPNKSRERKKLVDCFPQDLDVDKFLSSLHYDE